MKRMKKAVSLLLLTVLFLPLLPNVSQAAATGAPGTPSLYQSNWDNSPNYSIGFNMWWGNNGTSWRLYKIMYSFTRGH